jgi:hypothetical protein
MPGPSPPLVLVDSGSTGHYFAPTAHLHNTQPTTQPITVQVANQQTIKSTHTAALPEPNLPTSARQVHVFPAMTTSLLGVAPLVQAGCKVQFQRNGCTITCPEHKPIHCPRTDNGLWHLPANTHHQPTPPTGATTALVTDDDIQGECHATTSGSTPHIQPTCTPGDLVAFYHAALFSPALSTLQQALKRGFLPPFPGLTSETLRKHPPPTEATIMGHLDGRRKNIQSTTKGVPVPDIDDFYPEQPVDTTRTNYCFLTAAEPQQIVYTDQTGRLPQTSESGHNYVLVAYDYDSNAILLRALKNKTAAALTEAIKSVHQTLTRGGCQPKFHRLDNECPHQLREYFQKQGVQYQIAPPDEHRSNAAERAVRTAKNHLAAGWYSTDDQFPLSLWDKTIPQAELTLNLLRGSRINPKLSAWEQLHGRYEFNRHPIAPPGIKVLAHAKPSKRKTWDTHAYEAWYIGPAMEHYRCFTVWAITTRQTRVVNQLTWFPQRSFPRVNSHDLLRATLQDMIALLQTPPREELVGHLEPTQRHALLELMKILHTTDPPITLPSVPDSTAPPLGVPDGIDPPGHLPD